MNYINSPDVPVPLLLYVSWCTV